MPRSESKQAVRIATASLDATSAFFTYSRDDSDFALRLAADLKAAGASVWLDQLDIVPGQRWDRAVEDALARCPRMLAVLSPTSVASDNVMDEISFALEEDKTVIPILYKDCTIPFRLRRVQYVDFRHDYDEGLNELLKLLIQQPKAAQPPPAIAVVPDRAQIERAEEKKRTQTAERARLEEEHRNTGTGPPRVSDASTASLIEVAAPSTAIQAQPESLEAMSSAPAQSRTRREAAQPLELQAPGMKRLLNGRTILVLIGILLAGLVWIIYRSSSPRKPAPIGTAPTPAISGATLPGPSRSPSPEGVLVLPSPAPISDAKNIRPEARTPELAEGIHPSSAGISEIQTNGPVCGDPFAPCLSGYKFLENDLSFELPQHLAQNTIYYSGDFYAIILKSVPAITDSGPSTIECSRGVVSKSERQRIQAVFPKWKVFTSSFGCYMAPVWYTNTNRAYNFAAVYGGASVAHAESVLAEVRSTGQFTGANIRKMRVALRYD